MTNSDLIERNEINRNSRGGTELIQERLYDGSVPRALLEQFQIVFSRVRELDESRFRIFYAHDLPGDPESRFLMDGGWRRFHKLVFVSHWQMQGYISMYGIPWGACEVIENSILPIDRPDRAPSDVIRLVYTPTPHRGLGILYAVFDALSRNYDNIVLDVFSSFRLYGWERRDERHRDLFAKLDAHPKVNNHGTRPNDEIRQFLAEEADIFAYPSTWPETSCLCLIEAMSAGLMCVHSSFAALPETSAGFTYMYQFAEDRSRHASRFYSALDAAIQTYGSEGDIARRQFAKAYADMRFNWHAKARSWVQLLQSVLDANPPKRLPL